VFTVGLKAPSAPVLPLTTAAHPGAAPSAIIKPTATATRPDVSSRLVDEILMEGLLEAMLQMRVLKARVLKRDIQVPVAIIAARRR
jgi:hypothetical protein